ncbi:MAG: hypothetical protein A2381_13780 [Bdellovibrionales bacterium RIFOXYB1_FULL_37_110]|nr:MAG: hypothetical protein A2417_05415 [Bdellovibrionales bacterium RIFOXYC1_FULL_37_79]OFZ56930.1 MAG: hypothetical protein A2381_13780 [Bdellovibrionales bacterium RIFOXYB1_FULL_37_110]OFZ62017.1 MAG: hypothetical protein A2577_19250 [Bdellovibrionales bacterium RIFOXYD1_FULL_36_51]
MKLLIVFWLVFTLGRTGFAQLPDKIVTALQGNYDLVDAVLTVGECPSRLSAEYKWEESLGLAQLYLVDVSSGTGEYFQDLAYVDKARYSEFEDDAIIPTRLKRALYETNIEKSETGFILTNILQRQSRKNWFSDWIAWFSKTIMLDYDEKASVLNVTVKKMRPGGEFPVLLDVACKYQKNIL